MSVSQIDFSLVKLMPLLLLRRRTASFFLILTLSIAIVISTSAKAQETTFETPALNAGLGPVPDRIDRKTPRAAMASFLRAANDGDWNAAAHVLDLNDVDAELQAADGPKLARQLYEIIDRKAVLDWSLLLDRPDALQALGGENEAQAGEPRRSLLLRDLPLDPVPAEIRLNRVQPTNVSPPVWIFPSETVRDVPALHRLYGPSQFEMALPTSLRTKTIAGLMWWELIGLPFLVVTAIALGFLVRRVLQMLWRRADSKLATGILRALSTPFMVASVTGLIWWATEYVFVFSGRIDMFLAPAIATGFVVSLLLFIVNGVEGLLDGLVAPGEEVDLTVPEQAEARVLSTRLNAVRRILVVVVSLIGAGVVLSSADLASNLGLSLLTSAGALTLVLGFAARNVLANIMASLQIALNQSARVGDRVVFKGELCHVERINMTFVQLRNWDSTRLIVPVVEFVSETFSNWTIEDPEMLRFLKLKLDPHADVDALRDAFNDILSDLKGKKIGKNLASLEESSVEVAGQDTFGLDVWFGVPCCDPNTSWELACHVRERLIARAADIETDTGEPIFPRNGTAALSD
ncbi:mechanosensitive ion channel family protein [Loktanella sp. M215]|uniref:mechanosensitive ion channel family protein n=1 Tax=Loktanella sp. M215 TaxID=2675431 RepID=UPI001F21D837|nr:mechanosensitive ion channel domain-containing protein [Loktanella sp. M215]